MLNKEYEAMLSELRLIVDGRDSKKKSSDNNKRVKIVATWNANLNRLITTAKSKKQKLLLQSIRGMITKNIADQLTPKELLNHIEVLQQILGI